MNKRNYIGDFSSWTGDYFDGSVMARFDEPQTTPEPECVWAQYDNGGYDGEALVVFKQDDKWYYVHGSHCSCYGLENQWTPEEFEPALQLEAVKQGRTLIAHYMRDGDAVNEWLKEMTQ